MKTKILYLFTALILMSCSEKNESTETTESKETSKEENNTAQVDQQHKAGTVMVIVKVKTELSEEELLKIAKERATQFQALPGLIQKYYYKTGNPGEFGGVYIWDSMESVQAYKQSELAATIGQAYKTTEPPTVEVVDILFELRD